MIKKRTKAAPKTCEECPRWKEVRSQLRVSKLLGDAIAAFERNVKEKKVNPTMGDYLKLLQLEHEFQEESPKDITVRWVEPEPVSSEK